MKASRGLSECTTVHAIRNTAHRHSTHASYTCSRLGMTLKINRGGTNCSQTHSISLLSPFFKTIFVSSHMYPENPEGTQVIVGSMNMGYDYISDTARNRTHNLFHPKCAQIPLGHSDVPIHYHDRIVVRWTAMAQNQ